MFTDSNTRYQYRFGESLFGGPMAIVVEQEIKILI